jgi:signal transduction histidine kinase
VTTPSDFLAMLAHELRGPLAPMRTALEVLKRPTIPEPTKERARAIMERQIVQMARLIDDLVDIARIERSEIVLQRGRCTLQEVLDAAMESLRPSLEEREQGLVIEMPVPVGLHADRARLEQGVACLLRHASSVHDRGGPLTFRVRMDGQGVAIALGDELDRSAVAAGLDEGGLDLDLVLAQRLFGLHGGTLHAYRDAAAGRRELIARLPPECVATDLR